MFPGVIRPPTHAGPPCRKSQPTSHPPVQTSPLPNEQWLSPKADIDTAIVTPFSSNAGLISAASGRFQASFPKREEKKKFDGYPPPPSPLRINLDPLVLETMRRPGCRAPKKSLRHCTVTQTTQRLPPATRGSLSKPPHSSTSRHHVTLMPLISPMCPRPSTLAASSCWPQCLLSVFVVTPGACLRVLTVSPHVLILSGPRCFPLQLSGSLPRPTSGRNVTSGRRPTLLAARLALHTTLVKQPLASPSWSIVPVARACAHQDSCT